MSFKTLKRKIISWLGPWFAHRVIKILAQTMRFEQVHPEIPGEFWNKGTPFIGTFWHGRLLMMPIVYKGKKLSILVSPHRDGILLKNILKRFGFNLIEGTISITQTAFSAFRQMVKLQKSGSDIGFPPDGPRGPCGQAKMGIIELAKRTRRPILPLAFSASKKKVFNTWDRFLLPYPFSKGVFIWGEPIYIDKDADQDYLEEKRRLLENRLNELTEQADHYFDPLTPSLSPVGRREG
jgi:lysophospholipid acyltransferase (LPLAT)-like uncharacterized protein